MHEVKLSQDESEDILKTATGLSGVKEFSEVCGLKPSVLPRTDWRCNTCFLSVILAVWWNNSQSLAEPTGFKHTTA